MVFRLFYCNGLECDWNTCERNLMSLHLSNKLKGFKGQALVSSAMTSLTRGFSSLNSVRIVISIKFSSFANNRVN